MLVKSLLGFAVALFLTYPAAVLTTIIEGQSARAIYSQHWPVSLLAYFLVAGLVVFVLCRLKVLNLSNWFNWSYWSNLFRKVSFPLVLIVLVYGVLVFGNLGRADILGDDYDLAYQAYNLQDGAMAARRAYLISFNTHPPLFMTIKHYWFQILFPNGLETVPSWGYRGMEGIMGIATILAVYAITKNRWAALLLAVNNYMVFLGRVYLREMYLVFFLTLSIYFFQQKKHLIAAFLVGCGLLIKTSAVVVLPVYLGILVWQRKYRGFLGILGILGVMYLPVIAYNIGAFVTTGHMDATFSRIFGLAHPFLTGASNPLENLGNIWRYLGDIYSWPVLGVFVGAMVWKMRDVRGVGEVGRVSFFILLSSLFYFVFGGPLREYYLLFLTVPFVILTSRLSKLVLIPLIIFSLWYSVSSRSEARKIYEPVRGWPELVEKIKAVYQHGDCLVKSGGVNDLAMRAYFQTDDGVKKILLGSNYPHYYKMCDEVTNPAKRVEIYYTREGKANFRYENQTF